MTPSGEAKRDRAHVGEPPALSAELVFVVQLRAGTRSEQPAFAGRVEHMPSERPAHFESRDEFLAFIGRLLAGRQDEEAS